MKAEKIKIAIEKIKEASVKKLFIKVTLLREGFKKIDIIGDMSPNL